MAKNKLYKKSGKNFSSQKQDNLKKKRSSDPQYIIEETMEMRLDSCVKKVKDLSELIIGYTPYRLNFRINTYNGITNKPSKVSSFANAVVGIILADGQSSFSHIGQVLGLNVDIDLAEHKMLEKAIKQMIDIHLLEGDDSAYNVTDQGKTFAEHGEKMEPYPSKFSLWFVPGYADYLNLRSELSEDFVNDIEDETPCEQMELSIDEIKNLAEYQATHAHSSKDRFILQEAKLEKSEEKSYNLWACFIRSVRTKQVRVLIYDDNTQSILVKLSEIVDKDENLKQQLFDSMLGNTPDVEVLDQKDVVISDEQRKAEEDLLKAEEKQASPNESSNDTDLAGLEERLHKHALYDSISFETEIHTIFQQDNADEIWLSSPWVGDDAFMHSRLPLIQTFLHQGGKVFISYSEAEGGLDKSKGKGQMIGWQSNKAINQLAKSYPGQFFYAQFAAFHSKNVIEVKNGQSILFTGSFNVLSFHVVPEHESHIRKEEMALAHYQVAENKYREFKKQFAQSYIKRAEDSFSTLTETQILNYKNPALDYFRKDDILASLFADFDEKLDELAFSIRNRKFERSVNQSSNARVYENKDKKFSDNTSDKGDSLFTKSKESKEEQFAKVLSNAEKFVNADLVDEKAIFLKLASLCFLSIGDHSQKAQLQVPWNRDLIGFLSRGDVQKVVKINVQKGREEGTTNILVLMNETIFRFFNLSLTKVEFFSLFNRKEVFPPNMKSAQPWDLSNIILNCKNNV